MSRAARARRVATAAAFGGGGLGALTATVFGVIWGETKLARRRIAPAENDPPTADGLWCADGVSADGPPLTMAMLGDSSAAGYGVHTDHETPAVTIALRVSEQSARPVQLINVARVGAQSSELPGQVDDVLSHRPDFAVIMIGANDVTHRVRASESIRHLGIGLAALRSAGIPFVLGTCPDLGTIRPIAQPLRAIARRLSRTLAAAQTIAVVSAGGRAVSLGDLLGPEFAARRELFSEDQFHPSAAGYARAAEMLLPSVLDSLGLSTVAESVGLFASRRARPVARAAARAASRPGTEVLSAEVRGESVGRGGPWARLLRRRVTPPAARSGVGDPDLVRSD